MIIANLIRDAENAEEIFFLLNAYIEAIRFCDKLERMPEQMSALPLTGQDDLRARFEILVVELDSASNKLDEKACLVIKEALAIFSAALNCLQTLGNTRYRPRAGVDTQAGLTSP